MYNKNIKYLEISLPKVNIEIHHFNQKLYTVASHRTIVNIFAKLHLKNLKINF